MPERPEMNAVFESENGRKITRRQFLRLVRREDADVKQVSGGYVVDGVRYERV